MGLIEPHGFQGLQTAHYRAVMIDYASRFSGGTKGRPQHYKRMSDADVAALGPALAALAHPDGCHFFVWLCSPQNERFWWKIAPVWKKAGIRYSGRAFVWLKTHKAVGHGGQPLFYHRNSFHMGQGYTTRKNAEDCLLFKIGRPQRLRKDIREEIISPLRQHSRKPDEAYERITQYCAGPYAEVFSRQARAGWDVFGDEIDKFAEAAA